MGSYYIVFDAEYLHKVGMTKALRFARFFNSFDEVILYYQDAENYRYLIVISLPEDIYKDLKERNEKLCI